MEKLLDQAVANCLMTSIEDVEAIKQRILLSSLKILKEISTNSLKHIFFWIELKLVYQQIYEVVIYSILMKRLDQEISQLKNKKKIPQIEKKYMTEYLKKCNEIWTAIEFECYQWEVV